MTINATPASRRYSAVLISHPSLPTTAPRLPVDWEHLTGDRIRTRWQLPGWTACHAQHLSNRNFYSASIADERALRAPGGYVHDVLLALPSASVHGAMLVAAPYIYFLRDLVRKLEGHLGQPRPHYQTLNLGRAFNELADPPSDLVRIRQFSVQHRGSSSADRLSVSGRNPLRSDLGRQFATNAGDSAYGIRIEAGFHSDFKTNVNLDRHGNLWWFHRGEGSLANVTSTLDLLRQCDLIGATRAIPPDHKDDDE